MKKVKIVSLFLYIVLFILLTSSFVLAHPGHGSEYATEVTSSEVSDSKDSSYSQDYSSNPGSSQSSYSGQGSSSKNEKTYSDKDNGKSDFNDDKTNLNNNDGAINSNSSYNNTSSIELVENENNELFSLNNIIILVIVFISGVLIVIAINKYLL